LSCITAAPGGEHDALYRGFPNSYGTLGYALKLTTRTVPVKPYVGIQHLRHHDPARYFEHLESHCRSRDIDFIDGTVFSGKEMYLTLGRFTDTAISYNAIGKPETETKPHFIGEPVLGSTTTYDILTRVKTLTQALGVIRGSGSP
jgi:hypothetical protein